MCEVCEKVLSSMQVLQQHMRIHTGAMPYKCMLCDKSFRQMAGLGEESTFLMKQSLSIWAIRACYIVTDTVIVTASL